MWLRAYGAKGYCCWADLTAGIPSEIITTPYKFDGDPAGGAGADGDDVIYTLSPSVPLPWPM